MIKKVKIALLSLLAMIGMGLMMAGPVFAEENDCTTILTFVDCDGADGAGIKQVIRLVVSIMAVGVAILAVIGMVICGVQIITSRDNEAQVAKARKRIVEIIIGLVAWELMSVLIQLLVPGGNLSDAGLGFEVEKITEVIGLL